jgi:hypothetical protein
LEAVADQGWQVVRGKKGREQSGGKPSTLGRNTLTDTAVQKKMRDIVDANGYRYSIQPSERSSLPCIKVVCFLLESVRINSISKKSDLFRIP